MSSVEDFRYQGEHAMKKNLPPSELARDSRFVRATIMDAIMDPRNQALAERDLGSAKLQPDRPAAADRARNLMHGIFTGEIQALEGAGRTTFDFDDDEAPFALKLDMARQCWDESRHVEISVKLGEWMGTEIGEFNEATFLYEAACATDPILRLCGVNRALEGLAIDVFNTMREFGDVSGDPVLEFCEDWMLADEVTHVKMGSDWLRRLTENDPERRERAARVPARRRQALQPRWLPGRDGREPDPARPQAAGDGRLLHRRDRRDLGDLGAGAGRGAGDGRRRRRLVSHKISLDTRGVHDGQVRRGRAARDRRDRRDRGRGPRRRRDHDRGRRGAAPPADRVGGRGRRRQDRRLVLRRVLRVRRSTRRCSSRDVSKTELGAAFLRGRDRLDGGFEDAPPDGEISERQRAIWDVYTDGRLARLGGFLMNEPRRRYSYRLRCGFNDVADAEYERLWSAESLSWAELEEIEGRLAAADPRPRGEEVAPPASPSASPDPAAPRRPTRGRGRRSPRRGRGPARRRAAGWPPSPCRP